MSKVNMFNIESKIDLELIITHAVSELQSIRDSEREQRCKTQAEKRLAAKIKSAMRNDGRKKDSKKVKLSTFSRYLTKVRKAIAATTCKHHTLNKKLESAAKKAPELAEQIESVKAMTCTQAKLKIAEICQALKEAGDIKAAQELQKAEIMPELIKHLQLSDDERKELDAAKEQTIVTKQSKLIKLEASKAQALIAQMLASESIYELALGIALATGRRQIEVLIQGEFKAAEKGKKIAFKGQAKERRSTGKANIITPLAEPALILSALKTVRESLPVGILRDAMSKESAVYSANEAFNNSSRDFTLAASDAMGRAFGVKAGSTPSAFNASGWTFKDARAIFARMSYAQYEAQCLKSGDDLMDDALYFAQVLGHSDADAQRSYRAFKIIGAVEQVSSSALEQAKEQIIEQANTAQAERLEGLKKLSRKQAAKPFTDIFEKLIPLIESEPESKVTTQLMRTKIKGRNERLAEVISLIKAAGLHKVSK